MSLIIGIIACIYVLIAFYTDIRWMIIPNSLTLSAAVLGILVQTIIYHWSGLITSIIGLSVCFGITFGLYLIKGVGAGDVKGIAALGAIMGAPFTIYVLVIALIYAGVVGLFIILIRGRLGEMVRHWWMSIICYWSTRKSEHLLLITTHRIHSFPFMIAVLPSFITCLLYI